MGEEDSRHSHTSRSGSRRRLFAKEKCTKAVLWFLKNIDVGRRVEAELEEGKSQAAAQLEWEMVR